MLYNILTDRKAINALKQLSEFDVADIKEVGLDKQSAFNLSDHGLIQMDETNISISLRGKQFIKLLDELKLIVEEGKKEKVVDAEVVDDDNEQKK